MRWKKRHGIGCNAISGEIKSADNEAAEQYPKKLREIIDEGGYTEDQVYNCDETWTNVQNVTKENTFCETGPYQT